jgi:hypothetical protein
MVVDESTIIMFMYATFPAITSELNSSDVFKCIFHHLYITRISIFTVFTDIKKTIAESHGSADQVFRSLKSEGPHGRSDAGQPGQVV